MMPDKETRDIQAYLNRTLPRVRREKFEQRLINEPDFKAKFDELKPLLESIETIQMENSFRESMLNESFSEEETLPKEIVKIRQPVPLFLKYAAAAVVVLLIGIFWYDSTLSSRLYEDYYQPQSEFRGSQIDGCPDDSVLVLYYQKEYAILLEKLPKNPTSPCYDYYQGLCLLALNRFDEAKTELESGMKTDNKVIQQSAEWYLGLVRLKLKEKEKAFEIFTKISNTPEHQFQGLAKDILKDLKEKPLLFNRN
jgi:tetratricopeptide (TPR) repeat protein